MAYECFTVDIRDKVAHVKLNRPEALNSMVRAFWYELPQIVNGLDRSGAARAIVLSSTGKHFTAGMDLSVFTDGESLGAAGGDPFARAEAFRHALAWGRTADGASPTSASLTSRAAAP